MNPCVIIPAYNEAKKIQALVSGIRKYVHTVLVVDDGSSDQTAMLAEEVGALSLKHNCNKGKGAALRTAFNYLINSPFDTYVIMDGDGQHEPNSLPQFLETFMEDHVSIIVGNRMKNPGQMPFVRVWTNRIMSWIISSLIGQKVPDTQCGFKLIGKNTLKLLDLETYGFDMDSELLLLSSFHRIPIKSVPIRSIYADQESKIDPKRDTLRFLRLLRRFRQLQKHVKARQNAQTD